MLKFRVESFHFHVLPMRTRFPFRYGIASLDWLPHVVVTANVEAAGRVWRGVSADGLPPKWFTKNPDSPFEEDLAEMIAVIQNAARIGRNAGRVEGDFGSWWRAVYDEQSNWAGIRRMPPLLAGLGVSLVERAVLDALCRAAGRPLHELMRAGEILGDLGIVRGSLAGISPGQVMPGAPRSTLVARHTVGLGDWLREQDVPAAERPDDGLPASLASCAREYGLTHFKVKIGGDLDQSRERLRLLFEVLDENASPDWVCTLDGNESFTGMAAFRDFYEALKSEPALREGLKRVLFVEQPLRRDVCLTQNVGDELKKWPGAPDLLLDEGDGDLAALPEALRLGYSGVSHKNCKGILKGISNLALIQQANAADGGARFISGEDLGNVGPVALNQDLAVQAMLGVRHVERNGHHYFKGLSMWPEEVREAVLAAHWDLYRKHEGKFPALAVREGQLVIGSVNEAPFGCGIDLDWVDHLEPLAAWIKRGGLSGGAEGGGALP